MWDTLWNNLWHKFDQQPGYPAAALNSLFKSSLKPLSTLLVALAIAGCGSDGGSNRDLALGNDADLSNLLVTNASLTPTFSAGITSYTASVLNNVTQLTVTATTNDNNATLTINGTLTTSGTTSTPIALAVGDTNVSVVVTAENRTTIRSYQIVVSRAASANSNLTLLSLSVGEIDQLFDTNQPNYTASLGYLASGVQIVALTEDANASVAVNGEATIDGTSAVVYLEEGSNIVNVAVTAERTG